jgi:hypothetical protein
MAPLRRLPTSLVAFAALLALAGCGGGSGSGPSERGNDEEGRVRSVVAELQAASREGDGAKICNRIFTPKLANSVTSASKSGSCAKEVKKNLFDPDVRFLVEDVKIVDPTTATAIVKQSHAKTSKMSFVKQRGEWRIRSVGPA